MISPNRKINLFKSEFSEIHWIILKNAITILKNALPIFLKNSHRVFRKKVVLKTHTKKNIREYKTKFPRFLKKHVS